MKIKPLGDRVLVEPHRGRRSQARAASSSRTPPRRSPRRAKSSPLGTGKLDDDGKKIPFNVKKGDKVLMPKYGGTEVKIDDKEYQIMREDDILGIIELDRRLATAINGIRREAIMAAKQLKFDADARQALLRGRREAEPGRQGDPRARRAATWSSTRSSAPRPITKDGVTVAKEIELRGSRSRTWAPRWCARSPARPATSPATAPPPPPCSPRRSTAKA